MNNPRNLAKLGMYGISANYQIVFFGVWGGCSGIFRTTFFTAWLIGHLVQFDLYLVFFIGPESDHWLCLSLTDCRFVNLIDVTLTCEDSNSKLVEVVNVADVDAEDHVGNSLLIWELTFGHKAKLLFRL